MNKYIIQLLASNNRVIIPDFGAFIVKQKNPKIIVFNEFLRYNDGLLIDHLAKEENIDKELAKKRISDYVDRIGDTFGNKQAFNIEGLGSLVKEETGKISFVGKGDTPEVRNDKESKSEKPAPNTRASEKQVSGAAKTSRQEPAKTDATSKEAEKKETKKEPEKPEVKADKEEKTDKGPAGKEEQKELPKQKTVHENIKSAHATPLESKQKFTGSQHRKDTPPPMEKRPQPVYNYNTREEKRKRNHVQIIIWIILILLVNGAIIAWFFFNDEISGLIGKNRDKTPVEIVSGEEEGLTRETDDGSDMGPSEEQSDGENATAEIRDNELAQQQEQDPQMPQPLNARNKYYIVAGCFSDELNADNLVGELRQQGFNAEKFGKIGELHAVSYESFTSRSKAIRELENIRDNVQSDAWLKYQ